MAIDSQLIKTSSLRNSSKQVVARRIVFVPARTLPKEDSDGLTYPDKFLVRPDTVKGLIGWKVIDKRGMGLRNCGNTCYLNSVLQALTHSSALANDAISGFHESHCERKKSSVFCAYCALLTQVRSSLSSRQERSPDIVLKHLKLLAKNMRYGRQEDAHEFLRQLLDSCLSSELPIVSLVKGKAPLVSPLVRSTTCIGQVFSGFLQSKVTCSSCSNVSRTFDPFMDLSLEIDHCSSLRDCMSRFTKVDTLSGPNAYKCSKCQKRVQATKQMLVHRPPPLLTIQLKRFNVFAKGPAQKINKHIAFPMHANFAPYFTSSDFPSDYSLYAVIVHEGSSMGSGHYVCYAKASNGLWYLFDDSSVRPVSEKVVLAQPGYILMYEAAIVPEVIAPEVIVPRVVNVPASIVSTTPRIAAPAREDVFSVTVVNHDQEDEVDDDDMENDEVEDNEITTTSILKEIERPHVHSSAMESFCRGPMLRAVVRAKDRKVLRMLTVMKLANRKRRLPKVAVFENSEEKTPACESNQVEESRTPGWGNLPVSSWGSVSQPFRKIVSSMTIAEPGARSQHDFEAEQGKNKHNPRSEFSSGNGLPPSLRTSFNQLAKGGKGGFGKGKGKGKGKGGFGKGKGKGGFGKGKGKGGFGKGKGKGGFGKGKGRD